jgi:hypothetical protein
MLSVNFLRLIWRDGISITSTPIVVNQVGSAQLVSELLLRQQASLGFAIAGRSREGCAQGNGCRS